MPRWSWLNGIRAATSADEIRSHIWSARAPIGEVLREVARSAKVWDEPLLLLVLAERSGATSALTRNRSLPSWAWPRIAGWCVNRIESEKSPSDDFRSEIELARKLLSRPEFALGSECFERLLRIVDDRGAGPVVAPWRKEVALRVLLAHPNMTRDLLARLTPHVGNFILTEYLLDIASVPGVSPLVVHFLLERARDAKRKWAVVMCARKKPRLRTDPEVRSQLLAIARQTQNVATYRALMADESSDLPQLRQELAAIKADSANDTSLRQHRARL